jgi:hypothetical protein
MYETSRRGQPQGVFFELGGSLGANISLSSDTQDPMTPYLDGFFEIKMDVVEVGCVWERVIWLKLRTSGRTL